MLAKDNLAFSFVKLQAMDEVEANMLWMEEHFDAVRDWLGQWSQKKESTNISDAYMIKTFYEMAIQKTNRNMKRQGNHIGNSKKKNDLFKDRLLV